MKRFSFSMANLAVLLGAAVAAAEPTAADRATARALGLEAEAALASKDYAVAADRYARAEGLFHAPTLLLGLARADVGLGKLVEAEETYRRIVNEGVPSNATLAFREAVAAAAKELAAVTPRIAWLTITVKGAASPIVKLDDIVIPSVALGVRRAVDPGQHTVVATAEGAPTERRTLTLGEGKAEAITLEVHNGAAGDAKPSEPAPITAAPTTTLPAPSPQSTAVAPDTAGEVATRRSIQRIAGGTLIGVGGAGLIVGAVAGGLVIAQHGSLAGACNAAGHCPQSQRGNVDAYHTKSMISTVGFVVGAAAAGAGVVVWLTAPKEASAERIGWMPYVGLGTVGAVGRF